MARRVLFMTNEKSLISLALIKTNWEEYQKDDIDMLIPFVLYSIADIKVNDIVSITDTRNNLCNVFGIDLYNNVIETVFKRLSSILHYRLPYLRKDKEIYYRTDQKIDIQLFDEKRKNYGRDQSNVINLFYKFLQEKNITFDISIAENELVSYLCKYGYNIIKDDLSKYENTIWTKRIGEFIEYAHNNNEDVFNYLRDIAKGGMLSTIYFNNLNNKIKPSQRFRNTVVYLDTPLLLYILNYSGEALQKTVQELLDLLINNGARVCSFEHNLAELESILEAYVLRYREGTLDTSYNFDYLIEIDAKPEKIETDIPLLKSTLKRRGITIVDTPPYNDYWRNIGFTNFNDYLSKKIHYNKSSRRDNDVESIAAIYRLRSKDYYHYYENCEALFVATNSYLVYHTQKYFREEEHKKGVPAIVDDTFLTSLLWLKDSGNSDTLPTLKLIADALAAQEPSKNFWYTFNTKVDELKTQGEISDEEVFELKFGLFSKKNMFDVTEGDANKITHESVREVQKMNFRMEHNKIINEKDEAIKNKNIYQKKYEETSSQLIDTKSEKYTQKINRAKRLSHILGLLIISIIVYYGIKSVTSFFDIFSNIKIITDLGFTAFFIGIGGILNQFVDKAISIKADKVSLKILRVYINKIYSDINANEGEYAKAIILRVKQITEKTP